jgi:glycosyltransferase involved in cell wall biosynthesis
MISESKPLVSICMPAYNVERVLAAALDSVLAQTYSRFEVILVDDGSTDRTAEVARSFSDPRIRFIRNEKNLGGYQTMNKAVGLARGDFVAIYHSDDIYEPTIVEKEIGYLLAHPQVGAAFCLDYFMDDEGNIFGAASLPKQFQGRPWLTYDDIFPFLVRHKNIVLRCPTVMARRRVLGAVGPFDAERYDIAADVDMWIRIARRFPIAILDERLLRYRVGKGQWSNRYKKLRTEPELFFAIMDLYIAEDGWREKLSASDLAEYAFHRSDDETFRAANWLIQGQPDRARELLVRPYPWRALLAYPSRRKLRVLLFRGFMRCGLAFGAVRPLGRVLEWTEYGGKLFR